MLAEVAAGLADGVAMEGAEVFTESPEQLSDQRSEVSSTAFLSTKQRAQHILKTYFWRQNVGTFRFCGKSLSAEAGF